MFGDAFGSGGGFDYDAPPRRSQPSRPANTTVDYRISMEEAYSGKKVIMTVERDRSCGHCKGLVWCPGGVQQQVLTPRLFCRTGAKTGAKTRICYNCEGKGSLLTQRQIAPGLMAKTMEVCSTCSGTGTRFRDKDL